MPTETRFIAPSGGVNLDLSGIFADLDGGTSYGTATKFRVGSVDLTGYFHASTGGDTPSFNTGYKVNGTDLSAIFRRRGFVGIGITAQPEDELIVNGANATFSVTATLNGGAFTGTYRWRKNGVNLNNVGKISGALSASLTITGATLDDDAGSYDCVLTSGGSSTTSNAALLQVKPYITSTATVPSPLTEDDGAFPVAVQCYAKGSGTLYFSWFLNSVAVSGQQNQTVNLTDGQQYVFTLNSLTDGSYTCKVTSSLDATGVTSSPLVATINAPVVTALKINGTTVGSTANYDNGDSLVLSVDVTSAGATPIYSWYRNSSFVAQGTTYTISSLSDLNSGTYYCTVQNNGGSSTSSTVSIVRYFQSIITDQPDNVSIVANGTNDATFTLVASGLSAPTYQWQRNISGTWTNLTNAGRISGVNLATLTVSNVESGDNGFQFRCVVSNLKAGGSSWPDTTSSTATLTVVTAPSIISTNVAPGSYTLYYGSYNSQVLQLSVTSASGTAPLTYQWYKNAFSLGTANGANTNTFTKTITASDGGSYVCVVSNAYGSATTGVFSISAVNGVPSITVQPQNQAVNNNASATFSVSVSAAVSIGYQWKKNGSDIVGATSSSYTTGSLTTTNDTDTYFCNVYTNYGNVNSSTVSTKIKPYVTGGTVTTGPYYFTAGANVANFTVTAAGSPTLSYAWQFSTNGSTFGSVLSTSSSYNLGTVTGPSQTGYYRVTVSSTLFGVTYSTTSTAYMQVSDVAPTITGGSVTGGPYSLAIGNVANFTVTATGTNLTYAWQFSTDNSSWGGVLSTASNYTFTTSSSSQTGYYRVTVSNGSGSVSDTAYMDVS